MALYVHTQPSYREVLRSVSLFLVCTYERSVLEERYDGTSVHNISPVLSAACCLLPDRLYR